VSPALIAFVSVFAKTDSGWLFSQPVKSLRFVK
jgi:hypothetical protein